MKESVSVVSECKNVAEEDVWSGWIRVEKQVSQNQATGLERRRSVQLQEKSGRFVNISPNMRLS